VCLLTCCPSSDDTDTPSHLDSKVTKGGSISATTADAIYGNNVLAAIAKFFKDLKLPTLENCRRWLKVRGFDGWRVGVLVGCCTSFTVCCANIALLIAGAALSDGYHNGIAHLAQGSATLVTRWSSALHVLVNILGTLLLTASNYTMQVLSSPTRDEIDEAHKHKKFLDIGILSTRNLHHVSRKRASLWWILMISSLPLHILYVSCNISLI
jgi:hypothetical protein